jgi:hypothetical protein
VRFGIAAVGNKLFCPPHNASSVLVIDAYCSSQEAALAGELRSLERIWDGRSFVEPGRLLSADGGCPGSLIGRGTAVATHFWYSTLALRFGRRASRRARLAHRWPVTCAEPCSPSGSRVFRQSRE